mmetsp:Transcript_31012/g.46020  ORF Transcript_31012/g.46020 Transcript_31012/m.46020 type:complete len:91 (+) Transcript_31012:943-1215(+)
MSVGEWRVRERKVALGWKASLRYSTFPLQSKSLFAGSLDEVAAMGAVTSSSWESKTILRPWLSLRGTDLEKRHEFIVSKQLESQAAIDRQ